MYLRALARRRPAIASLPINPDQPGRFVQWLYPRTPVHAWSVPGTWFDVGSKENIEEANRVFAQFAV